MEGGEGGGATAIVVAAAEEDGNTSGTRINLCFDKAKLHCPVCTRPLKPPIFQCDAGHLACSACHAFRLPSKKCIVCGLDGSYGRNPVLEDFILSAAMSCPYEAYGCSGYIAYCEFDDHRLACPCAPCCCPERGCPFVGSPSMLIDHIADEHSHHRPIVAVRYGQELKLSLTAALRWQALAGQDRTLFLVSRREVGADTAVSLVCVRANAAAGAAPRYRCRLGVEFFFENECDDEVVVMESKVPSSAKPGEKAAPDELAFMGLYQPLDTVYLSIRIDHGLLRPAPPLASPGRARSSSRMQH